MGMGPCPPPTSRPPTYLLAPTGLRAPEGKPGLRRQVVGRQPPVFVCGEMVGSHPQPAAPPPCREARLCPGLAHLLAEEQPPGRVDVGEAHAARGHEQLRGHSLVLHGRHPAWQREGPQSFRQGAARARMTETRGQKTVPALGPCEGSARSAFPASLLPTSPLGPPFPALTFPAVPDHVSRATKFLRELPRCTKDNTPGQSLHDTWAPEAPGPCPGREHRSRGSSPMAPKSGAPST